MNFRRDPFISIEADAYVTAINILAVEYLIKTYNPSEYAIRGKQVNDLTDIELTSLYWSLALNMHTSTLGAMITQGDYENQKENLFWFLDHPEER